MSAALIVWIWTRNTLLGEVLGDAVRVRGLTVRHHTHPSAPPPEEAKDDCLLVVGPCVVDAEVSLWWRVPPPVLVLLRELAAGESTDPDLLPGRIRLPLPLDLGEFHRCLDAHAARYQAACSA
jgi:hypothetical protein